MWLSCPDMEAICIAYLEDKGARLMAGRLRRGLRNWQPSPAPVQQIVNDIFYHNGTHRNLFDFELLEWALEQTGYVDCARVTEEALLHRFPGFPPRNDGEQTLYVRAVAPA